MAAEWDRHTLMSAYSLFLLGPRFTHDHPDHAEGVPLSWAFHAVMAMGSAVPRSCSKKSRTQSGSAWPKYPATV